MPRKRKRKDYSSDEDSEEDQLINNTPKLPTFHEWSWKCTQLQNPKKTILSVEDIKQLLITRGINENDIKDLKKKKLIKLLTAKHTVCLKTSVRELTIEQLVVELRLHELNDRPSKQKNLVDRLIDGLMQKVTFLAISFLYIQIQTTLK